MQNHRKLLIFAYLILTYKNSNFVGFNLISRHPLLSLQPYCVHFVSFKHISPPLLFTGETSIPSTPAVSGCPNHAQMTGLDTVPHAPLQLFAGAAPATLF